MRPKLWRIQCLGYFSYEGRGIPNMKRICHLLICWRGYIPILWRGNVWSHPKYLEIINCPSITSLVPLMQEYTGRRFMLMTVITFLKSTSHFRRKVYMRAWDLIMCLIFCELNIIFFWWIGKCWQRRLKASFVDGSNPPIQKRGVHLKPQCGREHWAESQRSMEAKECWVCTSSHMWRLRLLSSRHSCNVYTQAEPL